MPSSATIKDVAQAAGVNISTVSRALNNGYGVHPRTVQRVIAAAKRLDYRPNRVARGLVTGRSHSLALIVSDIRNPFFAEVARGAEDAARAAGCDLILCNSDLDAEKQMNYFRSLLSRCVDGILMNSVSALSSEDQAELATSGVPIVLLNRSAPGRMFSTVCADNETGGALAAQYLLDRGHRKIAHLTGPRRHGNLSDRTRGFVRVLQAARPAVQPVILRGNYNFNGGSELMHRLLTEHPETTGVFAANDIMAFGAVRAALERSLRIPDDISLIGFDNIELTSIIHPPLTSIHQPKYEIGRAAVEILLRLGHSKSKPAPEHRIFGVELIERQSCNSRTGAARLNPA